MKKENVQIVLHVDEEGMMKPEVPKWAGMYYLDVDKLVIEDLTARGLIYRVDDIYPCSADVLAMPHAALLCAAGCVVCECAEFERKDESDE